MSQATIRALGLEVVIVRGTPSEDKVQPHVENRGDDSRQTADDRRYSPTRMV